MFNPFHHVWFHVFQSVAAPYYPMIYAVGPYWKELFR